MRSKNSAPITASERAHLRKVRELSCSCCDAPGPSEAHHIKQGSHFLCCAICPDCHRGHNGLHGTKAYMRIKKLDELDLLNITLRRLMTNEVST